jgi:hypothetical protein
MVMGRPSLGMILAFFKGPSKKSSCGNLNSSKLNSSKALKPS